MHALRTWLDRFNDWQARAQARRAVERMERAVEPARRMTRGQAWALLGYFAALLASRAWLPQLVRSPLRAPVALLPLPFIVAIVALSVRRVVAMDELQRRVEGVALAVAAIAAWLGLGVCWLLQHAGVPVPVAQLGFVGMPLLYVFARRWAGRRYA
ncbi:hypothetical protein QMK61_09045 [Fulvimonas sp. R45]|uniref:hypothetical protein n=1 Tax=Fulvimonas sp. R45 TaxID=3045937 RepID=UPI00265DBED3|nr:hypothetical protein [Fulvimonas sp. R45]MDO1528970.1 hypothetical protein [Fulvimonas sp. R45]